MPDRLSLMMYFGYRLAGGGWPWLPQPFDWFEYRERAFAADPRV